MAWEGGKDTSSTDLLADKYVYKIYIFNTDTHASQSLAKLLWIRSFVPGTADPFLSHPKRAWALRLQRSPHNRPIANLKNPKQRNFVRTIWRIGTVNIWKTHMSHSHSVRIRYLDHLIGSKHICELPGSSGGSDVHLGQTEQLQSQSSPALQVAPNMAVAQRAAVVNENAMKNWLMCSLGMRECKVSPSMQSVCSSSHGKWEHSCSFKRDMLECVLNQLQRYLSRNCQKHHLEFNLTKRAV